MCVLNPDWQQCCATCRMLHVPRGRPDAVRWLPGAKLNIAAAALSGARAGVATCGGAAGSCCSASVDDKCGHCGSGAGSRCIVGRSCSAAGCRCRVASGGRSSGAAGGRSGCSDGCVGSCKCESPARCAASHAAVVWADEVNPTLLHQVSLAELRLRAAHVAVCLRAQAQPGLPMMHERVYLCMGVGAKFRHKQSVCECKCVHAHMHACKQ
eukprot:354256-Chlamydomonas_euryale.AAC.6